MKIIEKSVTPFGTKIQLEDWGDAYPNLGRYMIGAYPIAENSEKFSKRGNLLGFAFLQINICAIQMTMFYTIMKH